ncbi:hypothetical protein [Leifsonia virtsii]|uniref:Uncharacterized protein n=1 Tax=Leifsonia virtsii TaxID=3035915 RepID=A0ABT8IWP7_9MICO|nr:hypothetical protein [Leifsonia virtsii]MDN4596792.1 hypothetical protein [Leifsonia virtsii]
MTTAPRPRRFRFSGWLIAAGAFVTVLGVTWGLAAKAAAEHSAVSPGTMPTLPVHVYAQITQRAAVPDYVGLWMGLALAAIGAVVLLVGAASAFVSARTA